MLVLTRKAGEKVTIGDDIIVTVISCGGERVRLGFEAPPDVKIMRMELHEDSEANTSHHQRRKEVHA